MPTDQELILATLDSIHAKLAGLVRRADEHAESIQILRNGSTTTVHEGQQNMILARLAHLAESVEVVATNTTLTAEQIVAILNRLSQTPPGQPAAQQLEHLQLLRDDVRALRDEILNLRDQCSIVAANVHHLASRIDTLEMLLPPYKPPSDGRQENVNNPVDNRQQPVDPIT